MDLTQKGIEFFNLAELDKLADAQWAEWLRTRRVGCAEYIPGINVIRLDTGLNHYRYEVDLDRCRSARELADWLFQLAGKQWCKGSVLTDFILCLSNAIEERHGQDPHIFFDVAGAA